MNLLQLTVTCGRSRATTIAKYPCVGQKNRVNLGVRVALARMSKKAVKRSFGNRLVCQASFLLHRNTDLGMLAPFMWRLSFFKTPQTPGYLFNFQGGYSCGAHFRRARHHPSVNESITRPPGTGRSR